jgi:hypothetical protein
MIDRAPAGSTSPAQRTLRTPRFVLRPFVPADAPDVQRGQATHFTRLEDVARYAVLRTEVLERREPGA